MDRVKDHYGLHYYEVMEIPEIELFARVIWGEARGELLEGQVAVANVITNRVADGRYGEGLRGVLMKPWAFSCLNTLDPNFIRIIADPLKGSNRERFMTIALLAIGDGLKDMTQGATLYHNVNINPKWASSRLTHLVKVIGNHKFYTEDF